MTDMKANVSRAPSDPWHDNTGYLPPKDKTMTGFNDWYESQTKHLASHMRKAWKPKFKSAYEAGAESKDKTMTDTERAEQKANQFYAGDVAKRAALQAAGGLASDKTLRDEFAGQALAGWIASADATDFLDPKTSAEIAYEMADAMLEARKTPEGDV